MSTSTGHQRILHQVGAHWKLCKTTCVAKCLTTHRRGLEGFWSALELNKTKGFSIFFRSNPRNKSLDLMEASRAFYTFTNFLEMMLLLHQSAGPPLENSAASEEKVHFLELGRWGGAEKVMNTEKWVWDKTSNSKLVGCLENWSTLGHPK